MQISRGVAGERLHTITHQPFLLTLRHVRALSEPFDQCRLFLLELGGEMYRCLDLLVNWGKEAFLRADELLDHQAPCQDFQPHQELGGGCRTVVHSSDGVDSEASRGRERALPVSLSCTDLYRLCRRGALPLRALDPNELVAPAA